MAALSALSLILVGVLYFAVGEQSLPAQGFGPVLALPQAGLTLPYMNDVYGELQGKKHADALAAISGIDRGPAKDRAKAVALLRRQLGSMSLKGQVALRLILSRNVAGLNASGHRVGGTNAAYRGQLNAALQKAQGLSEGDRAASLAYAINVWRLAEGKAMAWGQPPFRLAPFGQSLAVKAVIERAALDDMRGGHPELALRKYKALANSMGATPQRALVDLRVLDLSRLVAVKDKQNKIYEKDLIAAYKLYLDPGLFGEGKDAQVKATGQDIGRRHQLFVFGLLHKASSASTPQAESGEAVRMAQNFLSTLTDAAAIEDVKNKVATVYMAHRQYGEAVALYKELSDSKEKDPAKARAYLVLAIRGQSKLAAWPEQAPWRGIAAGNGPQREELLALYTKLDGDKKADFNWFIAAQRGLLAMNLGHRDEAFDLWQGLLHKNTAGAHAANAAGTMLVAYQKETLWTELEALARLAVGAHMTPIYQGKNLAVGDLLALALLENGKIAYADQKYDIAIKKFAEVVQQHAGFARHDEAFFMLASAYHGAARHVDAIKTLLAFVERYPRSGYYRQALLNGGDWSAPMAYEENTMFFFNRFVMQYGSDPEAQRVRTTLTSLYLGRARYGEALGVLRLTIAQSGNAEMKAAALVATMDVEERHGSTQHASQAADAVIASGDTPIEGKAAALSVKARIAAAAKRYQDVQKIASTLAAIEHPAAQEALGEARLLLAEAKAKGVIQKDYNLALNDPLGTLAARYNAYKGVRQSFQEVCSGGTTSFCAPAMVRLDQFSVAFAKAVEDIEVQETLAAPVIQKFNSYKQSVMNDVASTSQQAEGKALASAESGQTDPSTTEGVLWQASTEFSSTHLSGATGQGYVQWNAK